MRDYLQELFDQELSSGRLDLRRLPDDVERSRRLDDCYDTIQAKLGLSFLDRLNDLEGDGAYEERLACFRHGFRLAARLLME